MQLQIDGLGNKSITMIFPTTKNTIIKYDLANVSILTDNMFTVKHLDILKRFGIYFLKKVN